MKNKLILMIAVCLMVCFAVTGCGEKGTYFSPNDGNLNRMENSEYSLLKYDYSGNTVKERPGEILTFTTDSEYLEFILDRKTKDGWEKTGDTRVILKTAGNGGHIYLYEKANGAKTEIQGVQLGEYSFTAGFSVEGKITGKIVCPEETDIKNDYIMLFCTANRIYRRAKTNKLKANNGDYGLRVRKITAKEGKKLTDGIGLKSYSENH